MVNWHHYCNIPWVKKKKKSQNFCGPLVPPPNPTTHHSHPLNFTHISSLFWLALSFLSFIFFLFILLKHTHTHPPASTPKHTISPSFFPARSPEKYLGTPKHLHHFIWGKSSNLFWWVLCSCLRLFYSSFNNVIHVI